jgi:hypothetical protein
MARGRYIAYLENYASMPKFISTMIREAEEHTECSAFTAEPLIAIRAPANGYGEFLFQVERIVGRENG